MENKIQEKKSLLGQENLWENNQHKAVKLNKELAYLSEEMKFYQNLIDEINFYILLLNSNEKVEVVKMEKKYKKIKKQILQKEWLLLLDQKYDKNNAFLSIHAGTGGTDAQDWVEILLRMYLRFCEQQGWQVEILHKQAGNEAGLKRVELLIQGLNVYGLLKAEHGIHRLVRISPFDAEGMRHTSFALVEVEPELDEMNLQDFELEENDIKIDIFKAGGHGGQGVNTTDSAVRLYHKPTKIKVVCQNERSQQQNKKIAMQVLKSRVFYYYQQKEAEKLDKITGESKQASWGNQIRSYVMQPYQQVKDHRTDYVEKNISKVLDGDLLPFLKSYLQYLKT